MSHESVCYSSYSGRKFLSWKADATAVLGAAGPWEMCCEVLGRTLPLEKRQGWPQSSACAGLQAAELRDVRAGCVSQAGAEPRGAGRWRLRSPTAPIQPRASPSATPWMDLSKALQLAERAARWSEGVLHQGELGSMLVPLRCLSPRPWTLGMWDDGGHLVP